MARLKINRGTTYHLGYRHTVDGVPTSLVGATVRFTMKPAEWDASADDASAYITKDVIDGDDEGHATITVLPADTATIVPNEYFYDIKVDVNSDGLEVYKMDEGTVELDGSPTNRLS